MKQEDFLEYQRAMLLFYFGHYISDVRPQPGIPTLPDIKPDPPSVDESGGPVVVMDLVTGEETVIFSPSVTFLDKNGESPSSSIQLVLAPFHDIPINLVDREGSMLEGIYTPLLIPVTPTVIMSLIDPPSPVSGGLKIIAIDFTTGEESVSVAPQIDMIDLT